jgi:opacity protein-like surface antigen
MMTRLFLAMLFVLVAALAHAQSKPATPSKPVPPAKPAPAQTRPAPAPREPIGVRGFLTVGNIAFQAKESFETVLGSASGTTFGGGGQVLLQRGLYVEVSASRFRADGERVFVGPSPDRTVFRLGIPLEVTVTPLEITGGWRYRHCPRTQKPRPGGCQPTVVPYVGGGFSSYRYQESSDFTVDGDDVDERHSGYHIVGGAEYRAMRWLAIGGEVSWSSIADGLGEGGVSAAFDENNLGGTSIRLKISVGR